MVAIADSYIHSVHNTHPAQILKNIIWYNLILGLLLKILFCPKPIDKMTP